MTPGVRHTCLLVRGAPRPGIDHQPPERDL